jgi:hypothetical protein
MARVGPQRHRGGGGGEKKKYVYMDLILYN